MKARKFSVTVLLILVLSLLLSCVFILESEAATGYGIDSAIEYVQNFTNGRSSGSGSGSIMDKLMGFARNLFISLATLSLALGLIRMLLNGGSNIGTFASLIAKWILYVGIFTWIMNSNIPKVIVNSFVFMGNNIGGTGSIAPDNILSAGIRMYGTLVQRGWEAGWGDFLGVTLLGLIILVVVAMTAGLFALALIEMHLVICGGVVLLGFSGFDFTRDIAVSYLKYSASVGIKLMMIMIVYGLANSLIPSWETSFKSATDMSTLITSAGQILGGVITIFMTARYIPKAAQAIVNRATVTLGHPVYVTNPASYTWQGPSTITSSGGLVRTFIDALRGNRLAPANTTNTPPTAASTSMVTPANMHYGTNEGMITGSGYTPLGSMQTARQVRDPANAASMENYVGASILRSGFSNVSSGASPSSSASISMQGASSSSYSYGAQPLTLNQNQGASFMTSPARPSVTTTSASGGRPARVRRASEIVQDLKNQRMMNQFMQSQTQRQSGRRNRT